jgi:hypothetical protein
MQNAMKACTASFCDRSSAMTISANPANAGWPSSLKTMRMTGLLTRPVGALGKIYFRYGDQGALHEILTGSVQPHSYCVSQLLIIQSIQIGPGCDDRLQLERAAFRKLYGYDLHHSPGEWQQPERKYDRQRDGQRGGRNRRRAAYDF